MKRHFFQLGPLVGICISPVAHAGVTTVYPSQDTFVYEGQSTTNMTASFETVMGVGGKTSGHECRTLMQFDLTGLSIGPSDVALLNVPAPVNLFFPFIDPTPSTPLTIETHSVLASWNELSVTWMTQPAVSPTVTDAVVVTSTPTVLTFNITPLAQQWKAAPSSNHGIELLSPAPAGPNALTGLLLWSSNNSTDRPFLQIIDGDFDDDGDADFEDIDLLFAATAGTVPPSLSMFDLNGDGIVNNTPQTAGSDVDVWVKTVKNTRYGDSDLDGDVDTADFNALAANFNQTDRGWAHGDFDGNGVTNAMDFNVLATHFGYGAAPAATPSAVVPEPAGAVILLSAMFAARRRARLSGTRRGSC